MYVKLSAVFPFLIFCVICTVCKVQLLQKEGKVLVTQNSKSNTHKNVPHRLLNAKPNTTFFVYKDIDLKGNAYDIPPGVTLESKGGVIKNGELYGNNTSIRNIKTLFDNITIRGTWRVKYISTSIFKTLSSDNELRNVIALANPNVDNSIIIEKGEYSFSFSHEAECGISIPSNTKVIIDGNLKIRPNSLKRYYIVYIPSDNVVVSGSGTIIGDKFSHINKGGEWGMGVRFQRATNCKLSGLLVKNCWGDCICVSRQSKNIVIDNCMISNGRRQGISVTSADNVIIQNCTISNVKGTPPEYAIDIEPDSKDTVRNVMLKNNTIINCVGGISLYTGENKKSMVSDIIIEDCKIFGTSKAPFQARGAKNVVFMDCLIKDCKARYSIFIHRTSNISVNNNTIYAEKYAINNPERAKFYRNKILKGVITPSFTNKIMDKLTK